MVLEERTEMRNETDTKIFLGRPQEICDHSGFPKNPETAGASEHGAGMRDWNV